MPLWPGSPDIRIERVHYQAKTGVLTQKYTMHMHMGTHVDSPAHILPGLPYTADTPLESYYGTVVVVVKVEKKKWEKLCLRTWRK